MVQIMGGLVKILVSKTLSLDAKDVVKIENLIDTGIAENASDFVQKAVKNYINLLETGNDQI